MAVHDGHVRLERFTPFELSRQFPMRFVRFCHDHDARGVAVEPVHDPGPVLLSPHTTEPVDAALADHIPWRLSSLLLKVVGHRVEQGSRKISARRMNKDARLFIEHEQVVVLIKYGQRNRLGLDLSYGRRRQNDIDHVTDANVRAGFGDPPVDGHTTERDQLLHTRSAHAFKPLMQERIDAARLVLFVIDEAPVLGAVVIKPVGRGHAGFVRVIADDRSLGTLRYRSRCVFYVHLRS